MKIQSLTVYPYEIPMTSGQKRSGAFLNIIDEHGCGGWGEIAPLPKWSKESLDDSLHSLWARHQEIVRIEWTPQNCLMELGKLKLLSSASFGLESAILSIILPLTEFKVQTSALLMGSPAEILEQAKVRHLEGYTSAKLKVGNLSFDDAFAVINQLKDQFRLRIDVNRAWETLESFEFFSQFPLDTFDYVEEPFQNPHDLAQFLHPLAVDESFPEDLSLAQLETFPTLKALIYKPTIQSGMSGCIPLNEWANRLGIELVLSSSFETDLGLAYIASIAHRLNLSAPIGIGTFHFLKENVCLNPLQFTGSVVSVSSPLAPQEKFVKEPQQDHVLRR